MGISGDIQPIVGEVRDGSDPGMEIAGPSMFSMSRWSILLLVVALICAVLGSAGIGGLAARIAQGFCVFSLFLFILVLASARGGSGRN